MEDGITFGCFLLSLFSPSLLRITARYRWHQHGLFPLPEAIKWWWIFPVHRIRRKDAIELYRSVVRLMGSYDCVRRKIVPFFISFSFFSRILALAAQEVCAYREG